METNLKHPSLNTHKYSEIPCSLGEVFESYAQNNDSDTVAHDGDNGQLLHPVHRNCIKAWADTHPTCPTCRNPLELGSLFSWKERVINELNYIKNDAYEGTAAAAEGAGAAAAGGTIVNRFMARRGLPHF